MYQFDIKLMKINYEDISSYKVFTDLAADWVIDQPFLLLIIIFTCLLAASTCQKLTIKLMRRAVFPVN